RFPSHQKTLSRARTGLCCDLDFVGNGDIPTRLSRHIRLEHRLPANSWWPVPILHPFTNCRSQLRLWWRFPTNLNFNSGIFTNLGGTDSYAAFANGRYNTQFQLSEDVQKTWGNVWQER